ncbi:TolC family protein [Marinilabiliaceae bacterium JC017]|nr:TolC family protein [Marinilabiliaceae bacterium JC017]
MIRVGLLFTFVIVIHSFVSGQVLGKEVDEEVEMSLSDVIELAKLQSLHSFRSRNMYLARYWEFRSYKAQKLPSLNLNATPLNYNRTVTMQFSNGTNNFYDQEMISSNVGLSVRQNVTLTGGVLSINSKAQGLKDFSLEDETATNYTSTPVSVMFEQSLNGYNEFRWMSRIEPVRFEKAKREFISEMEDLAMQATSEFFEMVSAEINLKIAQTNLANADTLYRIGKGRFEIGTVTQDELLDLELSFLNSNMDVTKSKLALRQARSSLNSFLGFANDVKIKPVIPNAIPQLKVDVDMALVLAKENNPQMLGFEEQLLLAGQKVAQTRANSGLNASVNANLGINKRTDEFNSLYKSPFGDERGVYVNLNVPIVDWGLRKGKIQMAKSDREVTEATVKQARIDFEQEVINKIMEFNLQDEQVFISAKADTVAQLGYEVTKQRFMIDKVDVIKLNSARNSLDAARRGFINALAQYWRSYFEIRKLTLYDFSQEKGLMMDLDYLLQH